MSNTKLMPWRALVPLLAAASLFVCSGCANIFGKSGSASLAVSFSATSAKTVSASASNLLASISLLAIAIKDSGGTSVASATVSGAGATKTFSSLAAGSYTVAVNAYASNGDLVATGSQAATISADATAAVTVSLTFGSSTGTGGFSLPITWPASTGLGYVYATLDPASSATSATISSLATSADPYSATLSASGLAAGTHLLYIYFKADATASSYDGPFIESVNIWEGATSTSWLDSSGTELSSRSFSASDFAGDNASLSGLGVSNAADASALSTTPAFSASTVSYALSSGFTGTSISFVATGVVGSQNLACSWNGSAQSWSNIVGSTYTFTASGLQLVSGLNTFTVTVTAPDKRTTKTYTVTVSCGASAISISNPSTSYAGMGFASSASITQGEAFCLAPTNATLAAITSGWTWYLDGVAQTAFTGPSFSISPLATSLMIGSYSLQARVSSGGVSYTGSSVLSVGYRSSLSLAGTVATLVGSASGFANGDASTARFYLPVAVTTDGTYLYVADNHNNAIRRVRISDGYTTTIAGGSQGSSDGIGSAASFDGPNGITLAGNCLYVSDTDSIRKIALSNFEVTTLAGSHATNGGAADGTGSTASFYWPAGLTTDGSYLYLADAGNNEIRKVAIATGAVTTLAGSTTAGILDGTGSSASFWGPYGITTDGTYLYVSDANSYLIRKVEIATGKVTTLVGASGGLNCPWGLATDGSYLYVADAGNNAIKKIAIASGAVSTISGSSAGFSYPRDIAIYGSTLYVIDGGNNAIRTIN